MLTTRENLPLDSSMPPGHEVFAGNQREALPLRSNFGPAGALCISRKFRRWTETSDIAAATICEYARNIYRRGLDTHQLPFAERPFRPITMLDWIDFRDHFLPMDAGSPSGNRRFQWPVHRRCIMIAEKLMR